MRTLILNTQPAEKQEIREDGSLDVISVFPTIQGEGPHQGTPAVFVRLAGCNLTCDLCDTQYTKGRILHTVEDLLRRVLEVRGRSKLVVLTGGEPFRQHIGPLASALQGVGLRVQIETNGTLFGEGYWWTVDIVCSPKTPKLNLAILPAITAYKYVVAEGEVDPADGLPTTVLGSPCRVARPHKGFTGEVFLQPLDEKDEVRNKAHARAAVASCLKFGYRFTWQMHKDLGLE